MSHAVRPTLVSCVTALPKDMQVVSALLTPDCESLHILLHGYRQFAKAAHAYPDAELPRRIFSLLESYSEQIGAICIVLARQVYP